jgi:Glycosyl transferase family 11
MRRVVVKQTCGLGNQLFQYAAGRYYAKKHGASLCIATELPDRQFAAGSVPRPVMLQKYAVAAELRPVNYVEENVILSRSPNHSLLKRVYRVGNRIQILTEPRDGWFRTTRFDISRATRTLYLEGYWQTHHYALEVEKELRGEFVLRDRQRGRDAEAAKAIGAADNPVSIHMRKGDYHTFSDGAVLPHGYYDRAVAAITERFGPSTFFVFSDDPAEASAWAGGRSNFVVVDHNDVHSAHEDLRLMSQCRHHVIANSSFSWWGAWLNPEKGKHVIAPARWLGCDTAETHVALPQWQILAD